MLNVGSKSLLRVLLSMTLLTGCESPDLEVSSLDKKLPAPVLKGSSPFDQDLEEQNYVRIQGSCDTRVGNIYLSFDKQNWHQPPLSPDLTGTTLGALTNDRDCTDGSFDIYLTKNDLQSIWGLQTGDDGTDVDYVYLKGETLIGETNILTIIDSSGPGTGGNSPASKMALEKTWPRAAAGEKVARCSELIYSRALAKMLFLRHRFHLALNRQALRVWPRFLLMQVGMTAIQIQILKPCLQFLRTLQVWM